MYIWYFLEYVWMIITTIFFVSLYSRIMSNKTRCEYIWINFVGNYLQISGKTRYIRNIFVVLCTSYMDLIVFVYWLSVNIYIIHYKLFTPIIVSCWFLWSCYPNSHVKLMFNFKLFIYKVWKLINTSHSGNHCY